MRIDDSRLRLLYDLGCAFASHLEIDELVPLVVGKCREIFDAQGAAVLLLDRERNELHFPWVDEVDPEVAERLSRLRFPATAGIAGAVLESGTALRIDDVSADPRFYAGIDRSTGLATRAMLTAPLTGREGPLGVVQVVNSRQAAHFDDDDLAFLGALAGSVSVAVENARLWARMKASAEQLQGEVIALRRDRARVTRFADMIGTGAAMTEVFRLMESAAASPITVLIHGETGTGKELVARGIHDAGPRAAGPFVAVNCAALPESLLESELFGHRRGSFTGASEDRAGVFEAASGGTLFLDEIGEMPPGMQAKLLRVLQASEVTRVGEHRPRPVDVRVISATNRDVAAEVGQGRFRDDLFYRIGAFPIPLPPLRDRRDDIPLLAERFLARALVRHGKPPTTLVGATLDLLERFDWPGNVRELENEIERAVALAAAGEKIGPDHLSAKLKAGGGALPDPSRSAVRPSTSDLREARTSFEVDFIVKVLREHGDNVTHAAKALGISRVALQKKLKEYGLR